MELFFLQYSVQLLRCSIIHSVIQYKTVVKVLHYAVAIMVIEYFREVIHGPPRQVLASIFTMERFICCCLAWASYVYSKYFLILAAKTAGSSTFSIEFWYWISHSLKLPTREGKAIFLIIKESALRPILSISCNVRMCVCPSHSGNHASRWIRDLWSKGG